MTRGLAVTLLLAAAVGALVVSAQTFTPPDAYCNTGGFYVGDIKLVNQGGLNAPSGQNNPDTQWYYQAYDTTTLQAFHLLFSFWIQPLAASAGSSNAVMTFNEVGSITRVHSFGFSSAGLFYDYADGFNQMVSSDLWNTDVGRWAFFSVYIQSGPGTRTVTLYRNGVITASGTLSDSSNIQRWVYGARNLNVGPFPSTARLGEIIIVNADATRMNGGASPPQSGIYDGTRVLSTMILPMYNNGFVGIVSVISGVVQFDSAQVYRDQAIWWKMDQSFSLVNFQDGNPSVAGNTAARAAVFPTVRGFQPRTLYVTSTDVSYDPCHCAVSPTYCNATGTAQCTDGPTLPLCQCAFGYTGINCQTDINECASSPCHNGGVCTDRVNGFTCACTPGWSGATCQTNINECASAPCQNGATCTDSVNSFSCTCAPGYASTLCQSEINECASQPCTGGTTCVDLLNGYFCSTGTQSYCRDSLFFPYSGSTPAVSGTLTSPNDIRPLNPFTMTMWYAPNNNSETAPYENGLYPSHFALTDQVAVGLTTPPGAFPLDNQQRPPNRGLSIGIGFSTLGFTVWYNNVSCISSSSGAPMTGWHHYTGMARLVTPTTIELVLFIDGRRVAATSGTCLLPYDFVFANTTTAQLRVEVGAYANGALSNMRMFQTSFSDFEINTDALSWQRAVGAMNNPMLWFNQGVPGTGWTSGSVVDYSDGYFKQSSAVIQVTSQEANSRLVFRPCRCTASANPCSANATCVDNPSALSYGSTINNTSPCVCPYGYSGNSCTHMVGGCESNPCRNSGTCINGALPYSYTCQCYPGNVYYGQNCDYASTSRVWSIPLRTLLTWTLVRDGGSVLLPIGGGSSITFNTRSRIQFSYNATRYCTQLYPDGTRHYDPSTGFCRPLPPGYPPLSFEMYLYISLQQYALVAPQIINNALPRYVQLAFLRVGTTLLRLDQLPGNDTLSYSWFYARAVDMRQADIGYYDLLCLSQPGFRFDFSSWTCARDESELFCGLGVSGYASKDTLLVTVNHVTGVETTSNTYTQPKCNCYGGPARTVPHCRYKVGTDLCYDPYQIGLPGKSKACDVFTQESYYDCPTQTLNETCVETCRCLPGTGDMPGSTRKCSGQDMPCSSADAQKFCNNGATSCIKRCEFAQYNGYVRPTTYCAFVVGSCGVTSHQQYEACDPTGTASGASYQLQTYNYSASIPTQSGQDIVATLTPGLCICNADRSGLMCAQSSCPGACAGQGTCANGLCACSGGTFSGRPGGCGCQLDRYSGCMSNGLSCVNDSTPLGCQSCTGSGSCVTRPTDFAFEASCYTLACSIGIRQENPLPLLNCSCDPSHTGSYCQLSRCPIDSNNGLPCGGVSQGSCIVPVDGSAPYCTCRSSASTGQSLWAGVACSDDVGSACGATGPGGNSILCNGQGTCDKNATTGIYACTCLNGYTGAQCQNTPCNPPCPLHSTCVVNGASASCACDNGWTDTNCVLNLCGPRALPVATGPATNNFICQCTNSSLDVTSCTTSYSNNVNNCCKGPACPLADNGVPCGDNPQVNLYGIIPVATCLNGVCQCPTAYRRNTTLGTCMTYCDLTHTTSSSRPCNYNAGGACVSCTCTTGYDPATFCYDTVCKNGGTLSVVGSPATAVCTCTPDWTGATCTVSVCNTVGRLNATTGMCDCPFPYSGPNCRQHVCLNGGTPTTTPTPGLYACSCPPRWNGTVCQNNLCAPYGFPLQATNATCVCDALHMDTFCQTSRCVHGTIQNNACVCNTDQYLGQFCNTPRCGVTGTYDSQTGMCTCSDTGVYTLDSLNNNCTVSLCGIYGVPRADGSRCNCTAGAVAVPVLGPTHPYYCEPNCLNGGTFVPVTGNCTCVAGTLQPFCAFPGHGASSSSTGANSGGGDTSSARLRATHTDIGALSWTVLLFVVYAAVGAA